MKIIFMGSPQIAVPTLQKLHLNHEILAVFCAPLDIRSRRGKKLSHCPVGEAASELNLPIFMPTRLKDDEILQKITELAPDVIIVVAYGALLPKKLLEIPRFGCLNLHGSDLPLWRGAAPIERAIENGDKTTAICIMQMEKGLDTGPVCLREKIDIGQKTAKELRLEMGQKGAILMNEALELLAKGELHFTPQIGSPTYAQKITKQEALLNFDDTAQKIVQKIKAFNPNPVAFARLHLTQQNGKQEEIDLKIYDAIYHQTEPQKKAFYLGAKDGFVEILQCQKPGGKIISGKDFLNSCTKFELVRDSSCQDTN